MNLLSLVAFGVFAAGTIVSPIPDDMPAVQHPPPKPDISFGQIVDVLGEEVVATPTPSPTARATPTPPRTKKKSYTIAFVGDSMTDTMGPGLPAVGNMLSAIYPTTQFILRNFGVGATNIDDSIARIPAVAASHPDIVVLESCAYNPFSDIDGVNRHWISLTHAVDTIRSTLPYANIVIAATIAPNNTVFVSRERAATVQQYLESTVQFAKSRHLPLADAYHASLTAGGDGDLTYINSGDHIHYSDAGRAFFAQKIVSALQTVL